MGIFSPSAKVVTVRARPSGPKSSKIMMRSRPSLSGGTGKGYSRLVVTQSRPVSSTSSPGQGSTTITFSDVDQTVRIGLLPCRTVTEDALGNTIPSLVSSLIRTALLVIPAYLMSRMNGFALHWIWYLSVAVVAIHATLNLLLLRREYRRKLTFAEPVAGPLCLGYAGHYGLGLFLPLDEPSGRSER